MKTTIKKTVRKPGPKKKPADKKLKPQDGRFMTIRLSDGLLEEVKRMSLASGKTVSEWIRTIIFDHISGDRSKLEAIMNQHDIRTHFKTEQIRAQQEILALKDE